MRRSKILTSLLLVAAGLALAPSLGSAELRLQELLTTEEIKAAGLAKLSPTDRQALDRAVARLLQSAYAAGMAASADAPSTPQPSPRVTSLEALEGATLVAEDGTFLGVITKSPTSDSIGNNYGTHGSKYSSESIFNTYGSYGGKYSSMSPYNPYTSTPPRIYLRGKLVAYLTVNTSLSPRVDPDALRSWLRE